ncbi:hypothetical protein ACIQOV_33095, partial [Kitasatospora sp. NPDC091257]|uniref:hypothetical protein n=1 Tax=Kitasatospora sp. NPDC091257 TaxID=3364084 RepID=UPI0038054BDA
MPDAIDVPDDLIALQLAARTAQRAVEEFTAEIAAEARTRFPAPEQWLERLCWPADPPPGGLQDGPAASFWPADLTERLWQLRGQQPPRLRRQQHRQQRHQRTQRERRRARQRRL